MERTPISEEVRRERINRIRIGATGLAFIVLIVLLAVSISGTASNEPELTPEAIAEQEQAGPGGEAPAEEQPQEPLAELGVAPAAGTAEDEPAEAAPDDELPPAE